ncbi:hypothetical protein ASAP_0049 [Asaia bogorensis]|uniref:Uncharacterized protein n=1 Tax=Asaia bogorensis TaxID=91915 RepID=A0A060QAG9_9PROT|nr:hypothetical protein ASAP_0049 [Asaia bogorensis]
MPYRLIRNIRLEKFSMKAAGRKTVAGKPGKALCRSMISFLWKRSTPHRHSTPPEEH